MEFKKRGSHAKDRQKVPQVTGKKVPRCQQCRQTWRAIHSNGSERTQSSWSDVPRKINLIETCVLVKRCTPRAKNSWII